MPVLRVQPVVGEEHRDRRPVDIVDRYCSRLPVAVISDILGVDESEHRTVLGFGEQAAPSLDFALSYRQYRSVEAGLRGFHDWLGEHLDQLRHDPQDNLMSKLIDARTIDGERLTGTVADPIVDKTTKLNRLQTLAAEKSIPMELTMAVGDGANDLDMIKASGLGVALHAKPHVAAEADVRIDFGDLTALLYLQGFEEEDIVR